MTLSHGQHPPPQAGGGVIGAFAATTSSWPTTPAPLAHQGVHVGGWPCDKRRSWGFSSFALGGGIVFLVPLRHGGVSRFHLVK